MFLPFQTTMSLWLTPSPRFEWEPVPPVASVSDAGFASEAVNDPLQTGMTAALPDVPNGPSAMRWVFKGFDWIAYPAWNMRENHAWEQVAQTHRDEDSERNDEDARHARRVPLSVLAAAGRQVAQDPADKTAALAAMSCDTPACGKADS